MEQLSYYEILEISETASLDVIKASYRALAKKYHPDTYKGSKSDREKKMAQINEAYDVLSDEQKRKNYDTKLQNASSNQFKKEQNNQEYRDNAGSDSDDYENTDHNQQKNFSRNGACDSYDETEPKNKTGGWLGKLIRGVGKEIAKSIQNNSREIENAYLAGLTMNDYLLVKRFKQASGYKRVGYCKALEEKGLLERNYEGKLVPTYRFKQFF